MTRSNQPAVMLPGDFSEETERAFIRLVSYMNSVGDNRLSLVGQTIRALLLAGFAFVVMSTQVFSQTPLDDARLRYEAIKLESLSKELSEAQTASETPSVTSQVTAVMTGVQSETVTVKKTERWLVSEPWCVNCPPAKRRFKAAGNPEDHIITIAEALSRHGKVIGSVPSEYTTTLDVQYTQPKSYRSVWPPKWDVLGNKLPTREYLLSHLRNHENHKGKHWQKWYLESWKRDQLAALHDDDHTDNVPVDVVKMMVVDLTNAQVNEYNLLTAVAQALYTHESEEADPLSSCTEELVNAGWFEYDVQVPDVTSTIIRAMMKDKSYENPALGVTLTWPGKQTLSFDTTSIALSPPVSLKLAKWGVKLSASVSEFKFTPDYKSVTVVTPEIMIPDVTVNFK
jgi:hypothetical protein